MPASARLQQAHLSAAPRATPAPSAAAFSQLDPMSNQTAHSGVDPIAASYTNREYVGVECLWLEAVTLLLLSIGILNACLEAKKLKESCAGVIGAMVLATFGLAAAVVIRLPCVPLQPNYDGLMQVRQTPRHPPSTDRPTHPRTHRLPPHLLTSPQSGSGELGRVEWTRWSGVGGVDVRGPVGGHPWHRRLYPTAPPCYGPAGHLGADPRHPDDAALARVARLVRRRLHRRRRCRPLPLAALHLRCARLCFPLPLRRACAGAQGGAV